MSKDLLPAYVIDTARLTRRRLFSGGIAAAAVFSLPADLFAGAPAFVIIDGWVLTQADVRNALASTDA